MSGPGDREAYVGKRLRFRCNRWIREGQAVRCEGGGRARIDSVTAEGVRVAGNGWSRLFPWGAVWRGRAETPPFVRAWRPIR